MSEVITLAPTRATTLPTDGAARKGFPIASGVCDYFPDALVALAEVSKKGNDQHHPGQPLHWDRAKSTDEADTMIRHFLERGTLDIDGLRHTAKMAWRALALLQKEIEAELRLREDQRTKNVIEVIRQDVETRLGRDTTFDTVMPRYTCPQDGQIGCCEKKGYEGCVALMKAREEKAL